MRQKLPAWAHGWMVGVSSGALLWMFIDATVKDTTGIGLALSAGLALAVAHIRTAKVTKRRAWFDAEAAAIAPTRVP